MREAVKKAALAPAKEQDRMREAVRLAVRRVATDWTGKKPVVDVMLVQL
jgi:ribonuclease J